MKQEKAAKQIENMIQQIEVLMRKSAKARNKGVFDSSRLNAADMLFLAESNLAETRKLLAEIKQSLD